MPHHILALLTAAYVCSRLVWRHLLIDSSLTQVAAVLGFLVGLLAGDLGARARVHSDCRPSEVLRCAATGVLRSNKPSVLSFFGSPTFSDLACNPSCAQRTAV
jgi:hypothetical protein